MSTDAFGSDLDLHPPIDAFGRTLSRDDAERPFTRGEASLLAKMRKDATSQAIHKLVSWLIVLIIISVGVGILTAVTKSQATADNQHRISDIQSGRKAATKVTCGLYTAILSAVKEQQEGKGQTAEQSTAIQKLGFSKAELERLERLGGAQLVLKVRRNIEGYVGGPVKQRIAAGRIVNDDGKVNCANLRIIAGLK